MNTEIVTLSKALVKALNEFKGDGLDEQIASIYLHRAFKLGDKHGWQEELDQHAHDYFGG